MTTRTAIARRRPLTAARRTEIRIAQLKRERDRYKGFFRYDYGDEAAIRAVYHDRSPLIEAFVVFRKAVATCPIYLFKEDYQAQALLTLATDLHPFGSEHPRADWLLVGLNTRIKKWIEEWKTVVPVQFMEVRNTLHVLVGELDKAAKKGAE